MGSPREFVEMLAAVNTGQITPVIDRTFPLAEANEAHRRLEQHGQFGKIVLAIDQDDQ